MKRLLCSLVLLCGLFMTTWAGITYFPQTLVDFPTNGDPQPEQKEGHMYYRQYVWWYWNDDMSGEPFDLSGYESDFLWSVDVTGDITIPQGKYVTHSGNHYELSSSEIFFDGTSGTITMTATQPYFAGDGQAHTATYTINYHLDVPSQKWDFYSKRLEIGRYKDGNSELNNGALWSHQWMANAGQSPELYAWVFCSIDEGSEQYFRQNFGRDGHIIKEANGLEFIASSGNIGIFNENDSVGPVSNRFLAIKQGSSMIIPKEYFSGYSHPRVRIKMNKYGDNIGLTIHNAYDAIGKEIKGTGTYVIGGSAFWGGKKDWNYRGEYHFQIKDKTKDFKIDVASGQWLMLFTVEVYDSEAMITENSVLGAKYQFLNSSTSTQPESGKFYLHYRGKGERTRIAASTITTTGTVTNSINDFTNVGGGLEHNYTSHIGEFGSFRMRIDSYTLQNDYCTDYAYRTQSVGYMAPKSYPYTWDFTDIQTYQNADFKDNQNVVTSKDNKMVVESTMGYKQQPANDHFHGIFYIPRNVWDSDGSFRLAHDGAHNIFYCGGSQLWYGKTIIPETAGLAFTPVNYDGAYNGAMTLTSDGLKFDQNIRDWWLWRITVPQVDTECTIYVRAKKLRSDNYYNVGYCYCYVDDSSLNLWNGDATNKTPKTAFSTAALTSTKTAREIAVDGDEVIYAIPAPAKTTNVALYFTGVEVHKIAVSKDPKIVNKYGWATESRNRVIDQSLTSYFTGKQFETCLVDNVNYGKKEVALSRVDMDENVMNLTSGDDNNAYIIHNTEAVGEQGKVDILAKDDGFHLFVPDIHDYVLNNGTYNQKDIFAYPTTMKAQLAAGKVLPKNTDGTTNFVLTWQVADVEQGEQGSTYDFGYVGFFRVQDAGVQSKGNQGYLPLNLNPSNSTNKFNLVWADDVNGIDATIADNAALKNDNVYYNLSGQRIKGVPAKGGIYIVNGKKTVVK